MFLQKQCRLKPLFWLGTQFFIIELWTSLPLFFHSIDQQAITSQENFTLYILYPPNGWKYRKFSLTSSHHTLINVHVQLMYAFYYIPTRNFVRKGSHDSHLHRKEYFSHQDSPSLIWFWSRKNFPTFQSQSYRGMFAGINCFTTWMKRISNNWYFDYNAKILMKMWKDLAWNCILRVHWSAVTFILGF